MNPLRKFEELVLENIVNHLSICTRFQRRKYGDVVSMLEEVNAHYHTKTCRKKLTQFRFHFKKVHLAQNHNSHTTIRRKQRNQQEDITKRSNIRQNQDCDY